MKTIPYTLCVAFGDYILRNAVSEMFGIWLAPLETELSLFRIRYSLCEISIGGGYYTAHSLINWKMNLCYDLQSNRKWKKTEM